LAAIDGGLSQLKQPPIWGRQAGPVLRSSVLAAPAVADAAAEFVVAESAVAAVAAGFVVAESAAAESAVAAVAAGFAAGAAFPVLAFLLFELLLLLLDL